LEAGALAVLVLLAVFVAAGGLAAGVVGLALTGGVEAAGASALVVESAFFERLFFAVLVSGEEEVSDADADAGAWPDAALFFERLFFAVVLASGEEEVSAACAESAVAFFFDRLFFFALVPVSDDEDVSAVGEEDASVVASAAFFFFLDFLVVLESFWLWSPWGCACGAARSVTLPANSSKVPNTHRYAFFGMLIIVVLRPRRLAILPDTPFGSDGRGAAATCVASRSFLWNGRNDVEYADGSQDTRPLRRER
jgi:hypothetical protein